MEIVNIHQAKTHLSRLVERAAKGEAFVIAKGGKPMVKVVPLDEAQAATPERIGFLDGLFDIPDDFDRLGEQEIEQLFGERA